MTKSTCSLLLKVAANAVCSVDCLIFFAADLSAAGSCSKGRRLEGVNDEEQEEEEEDEEEKGEEESTACIP